MNNKRNPKVSIIIPSYNNGRYIGETLESIRTQSFDDFEAIVINDGSVDNTEAVIDTFVEKDSRFIKISQENQGVSAARNAGLAIARGEFIGFVDGDDIVPQGAFQEMANIAENYPCEMIVGGVCKYEGFTETVNGRVKKLNDKRALKRDDLDLVHSFSLCNKWFLHDVIRKHEVRFEPFRHCQDGVFVYRFMRNVNKIVSCDAIVYNYMKRIPLDGGSVTQAVRPGLISQAMGSYNRICDYTEDYPKEFKQELAYRMNSTTIIGDYYKKIWYLNEEDETLVLHTIKTLYEMVTEDHKQRIIKNHKGSEFEKGFRSKKEILADPLMTVAVVPGLTEKGLGLMLKSLYGQALPSFRVIVDDSYRDMLPDIFMNMQNLEVMGNLAVENLQDNAYGRFLWIVDRDIIFDYNTLEHAYTLAGEKTADCIDISMKNSDGGMYYANRFFSIPGLKSKGIRLSGDVQRDMSALRKACTVCAQEVYPVLAIREDDTMEKILKRESTPDQAGVLSRLKKIIRRGKKKKFAVAADALDQYLYTSVEKGTVIFEDKDRMTGDWLKGLLRKFSAEMGADMKAYVAVNNSNKAEVLEYLKENGLQKITPVIYDSREYKAALFTSEYMVNDTSFPNYWIKKDGQKYVSAWNDEVKRVLDGSAEEIHETGLILRDALQADYFICCGETCGHAEGEIIKAEEIAEKYKRNGVTVVYSDGWHSCISTEKMYRLAEEHPEITENAVLSYRNIFVRNSQDSAYPLLKMFRSYGTKGKQLFTKHQKEVKKAYLNGRIPFSEAMVSLENAYKLEIKRCYGNTEIGKIVLYDTMDYDKIIAFSFSDAEKILYIHEELADAIAFGSRYACDAVRFFAENGGQLIVQNQKDMLMVEQHLNCKCRVDENMSLLREYMAIREL